MRALLLTAFLGLGALAVACGSTGEGGPTEEDAGATDGAVRDAAATDANAADARTDASSADARADGAAEGGAANDGAAGDGATSDAASSDAATGDAATGDAAIADAGPDPCAPCNWSAFGNAGPVTPGADMAELSGLAASATRPGILYAHNDSGDTARFFALDGTGLRVGEYALGGVTAIDWEDIAVGPCGSDIAGSCVFLADIGDNLRNRASVTIYRVSEPQGASGSVASSAISFTYPDAPHDAEALFIDGVGALHVVTKETNGASTVFSLGIPGGNASVVATKVGKLPPFNFGIDLPSRVTGADFFPAAQCPKLVIRTYGSVELFTGQAGDSVATLIARAPKTLPRILSEQQGEAVAFSRAGTELFTVGETASATLHRADCR